MRCIDKLKEEYPEMYESGKWKEKCPHVFGYAVKPKNCDIPHHYVSRAMCEDCWYRDSDEDLNEGENEMIEHDILKEDVVTPKILDSGNRREFETGAVRDIQEGKGRCDLMPLDVLSTFFYILSSGISTSTSFKFQAVFGHIDMFMKYGDYDYLFSALVAAKLFDNDFDMFLEVSKHFEDGAKKYGENNWQKGIPTHCYIDSAVRHYLKYLRGDTDERHDRAFCWNIICCIWTCIHKPELNDYCKRDEE